MPICSKCGKHYFNKEHHKCPLPSDIGHDSNLLNPDNHQYGGYSDGMHQSSVNNFDYGGGSGGGAGADDSWSGSDSSSSDSGGGE